MIARQHPRLSDAHLLAHLGCNQRAIARDDLEPHTQLIQPRQGGLDACFRGVGKGENPKKGHLRFQGMGDRVRLIQPTDRDPQGAVTLSVECLSTFLNRLAMLSQGHGAAIGKLRLSAHFKHIGQGTFGDQEEGFLLLGQHTEALALEVVGQLIALAPAVGSHRAVAADCCIDRVAEGALEARVQPGVEQHLIAGLAQHINGGLKTDLTFCEGACFIGAQNVHAAEILDGSKAAHNHM